MNFSKLSRGEGVAVLGSILLLVAVFLKWYSVANKNGILDGRQGPGDFSVWQVQPILRILLLLAAIAPIVLAYIILRDHTLSWPRGELTAVVAIAAIGLIFYNGIIARPGDPSGLVSLRIGWYIAFVGAILMLGGSVIRQQESETRRKPPGTL